MKDNSLKLIDFGLIGTENQKKKQGTPLFCHPLKIQNFEGKDSFKYDIYAMGLIALFILEKKSLVQI